MLPAKHLLPVPSQIEVLIKPQIESGREQISPDELMRICRNSILENLNEPDIGALEQQAAGVE